MLHKIRAITRLREDEYILYGECELDDGSFETVSKKGKNEKRKRGKGSQKQTNVLLAAESTEVKPDVSGLRKDYKKNRKFRFIKMKVINSFKKERTKNLKNEMIQTETIVLTDGLNSYNDLKIDYERMPEVLLKMNPLKNFHGCILQLAMQKKNYFLMCITKLLRIFLQNYLNEFTYKLNRRYFVDLFGRLLMISTQYRWNWLGETHG